MDKTIEIPFGAKDSELKGWEYTIPENMEAEIKDGKIIVRPKEGEDERIRKEMVEYFSQYKEGGLRGVDITPWIAYLERQKEQAPEIPDTIAFQEGVKEGRRLEREEHKSAEWREEDEGLIDLAVAAVEDFYDKKNPIRVEIIKFLKFLRPQPKQELSSEEKRKLNRIYFLIRSATAKENHPLIGDNEANELQGFLSNLSERFK